MKDHSVEGYLERLSSEDLEAFMRRCMQRCQWDSYDHLIPKILEILKKRNYTIAKSILASWESYRA